MFLGYRVCSEVWAEWFDDVPLRWAKELVEIVPAACSESLAAVVLGKEIGGWSLVLVETLVHTEVQVWFDELIENVALV